MGGGEGNSGCWVLMPPQLSFAMQGVSWSLSAGTMTPWASGVNSGSACPSQDAEEATVAKVRSARRPKPEKQTLVADD